MITIKGIVNAPGGGGEGGHYGAGGGGGGSGGAILIEGIMVQVDGLVAANGGGGSGAALNISTNAPNGESGKARSRRSILLWYVRRHRSEHRSRTERTITDGNDH